jgi:RHS repeat-associated protein
VCYIDVGTLAKNSKGQKMARKRLNMQRKPLRTTQVSTEAETESANGLVYLRARYYNPALGVFPSLDPSEDQTDQPMSLNGYSWVEGNPVNDAVGEPIARCQ